MRDRRLRGAARRRRAARPRVADGHGRGHAPPRPRRVRALPRSVGPASPTPGCRSSTWRAASSRCPTRPAGSGSSSTARSSTTSSCATSSRRAATASGPGATPRSSSTPTRSGATRPSAASTASGRSRCGRPTSASWCWPATPTACGRCTSAEHGGRLYFAQRGEGDLRRRRLDPARLRSGRASTRSCPFWGRCRRGRCSPASRRSSPARVRTYHRGTVRDRVGLDAVVSRRRARAASTARSTTRSWPCARRSSRRRACACCAPTCRSAATCRAGSTARSSPRSGCAPRAAQFSTFSLRFEDAEYDETGFQRQMVEHLGSDHHEVDGVARRHRARLPRRHPPHRAADPAHRAGAAVPAVEAGAGRRHQGRADRRGRRRAVRRLRPVPRGQGAALLGPRAGRRSGGRCCSIGCIRTWRARRCRSGRWPGSSSASSSARGASPASATIRAGARPRRCGGWCCPGCGPAAGEPDVRDAFLGALPPAFASWSTLGAGPVHRDPHAALRLPALGAGRPHADGALGRRAASRSSTATSARWPTRCRRRYKLRVLDEKHVLKKAAQGPGAGVDPGPRPSSRTARRTRWPSPAKAPSGSTTIASDRAVRDAGVFAPALVAAAGRQVPGAGRGGAVLEQRQHGRRRRAVDAAAARPVRPAPVSIPVRRCRSRPGFDAGADAPAAAR